MTEMSANVEAAILATLKEIKYGRVEITVHDSEVVQVEATTRTRFPVAKETK